MVGTILTKQKHRERSAMLVKTESSLRMSLYFQELKKYFWRQMMLSNPCKRILHSAYHVKSAEQEYSSDSVGSDDDIILEGDAALDDFLNSSQPKFSPPLSPAEKANLMQTCRNQVHRFQTFSALDHRPA